MATVISPETEGGNGHGGYHRDGGDYGGNGGCREGGGGYSCGGGGELVNDTSRSEGCERCVLFGYRCKVRCI